MSTLTEVSPDEARAQVLALCREVLKAPDLTFDTDLFEAGIDSLTATKIVADLRDALGANIGLIDLFETPEIGAFADLVVAAPRIG